MHASIRNTRSTAGFTIVELLIVIVVTGVLAAITIVAFNGVQARAHFTTAKQDMATIKKALALYYADNQAYPNSANCVNTSGEYNYQHNWCGWDQGQGDSFIPGLVPKYLAALPTLDKSLPQQDSYLYQSGNEWGVGTGGTAQYQLIRFRSTSLSGGGLSSAEKENNPDILNGGPGGYTGNEAWGFKSEPTTDWW